ncbi:MAG: hypothetical protein Q8L27_04035, partial [archaeon]|nr:hypothetical protein [archaeon]
EIGVCTHNVVLRVLLGKLMRIPQKEWHKITIPHLDPLKIILTKDKRLFLDLDNEQIKIILKKFQNG